MIETDSSFDDLAKTYDEFRIGYSRELYDQLQAIGGFEPGNHILDVGCGTAIASAPLAQRGLAITGIDPSEPMLAHARIRVESGRFIKAAAEKLPFKDNEFDGAISAQAIHWFDQPKAIAEMDRVVRPGGRVAIWWKKLVTDEPLRVLREQAATTVGVELPGDLMQGSFSAFYAHQFKERWLRVVPFAVMSDVDKWMGYERSRRRTNTMGEKYQEYLDELEQIMREKAEGRPFQVRYVQYLYVGEVK